MRFKMEDIKTGETIFDDWESHHFDAIIYAVRDECGKTDGGEFAGYTGDYMLYFENDESEWEPVCELYGTGEYNADDDGRFQW